MEFRIRVIPDICSVIGCMLLACQLKLGGATHDWVPLYNDPDNSELHYAGHPEYAFTADSYAWVFPNYNAWSNVVIPDPSEISPFDGKLLNLTVYGSSPPDIKLLALRSMTVSNGYVTYQVQAETNWLPYDEYSDYWYGYSSSTFDDGYLQVSSGDVLGIQFPMGYGFQYRNTTSCYTSSMYAQSVNLNYDLSVGSNITAEEGDSCLHYPYFATVIPNDVCTNVTVTYEIDQWYHVSDVTQNIQPYDSMCWHFALQDADPSETELVLQMYIGTRTSGTEEEGPDGDTYCVNGGTMEVTDGDSGTHLRTICSDTDLGYYSVYSLGRTLEVKVTADFTLESVYFDVHGTEKEYVPSEYFDQFEESKGFWSSTGGKVIRYLGYGVGGLVGLIVVIAVLIAWCQSAKVKRARSRGHQGARVGQQATASSAPSGPAASTPGSGAVVLGPQPGKKESKYLPSIAKSGTTGTTTQQTSFTAVNAQCQQGWVGQTTPHGNMGYPQAAPQGSMGYPQAPPQGNMGYSQATPQGNMGYPQAPPQGNMGYPQAPPPLLSHSAAGGQPMSSYGVGPNAAAGVPPSGVPPPTYNDLFSVSNAASGQENSTPSAWTTAIPPPAVYNPK